jgi:hypothetical protein
MGESNVRSDDRVLVRIYVEGFGIEKQFRLHYI